MTGREVLWLGLLAAGVVVLAVGFVALAIRTAADRNGPTAPSDPGSPAPVLDEPT